MHFSCLCPHFLVFKVSTPCHFSEKGYENASMVPHWHLVQPIPVLLCSVKAQACGMVWYTHEKRGIDAAGRERALGPGWGVAKG